MTTSQLEAKVEELAREVAALREEVAALTWRPPSALEFASRVTGQPLTIEEFHERGREFADAFEARFGSVDE
jgi:hypothetical protein